MLSKALSGLPRIAGLGICAGSAQLAHYPVERGRHALATADLVILLRTFPEHDEWPALRAVMPEASQGYAHRWRIDTAISGVAEGAPQNLDRQINCDSRLAVHLPMERIGNKVARI
jgi:hypothetical protein